MIGSVHLADVGLATSLRLLMRTPVADGLSFATMALAAPLSASVRPSPNRGRIALVSFWEDSEALDRFEADEPTAAALAGGWRVRLKPLRRWGRWPGLPEEVPTPRHVGAGGPRAVLTLGRLKLPQAVRFVRTSAKAEGAALTSPGYIWGTALARPPFVATCSLWQTTAALSEYSFERDGAHHRAIDEDRRKGFHEQSAFVRFEPYAAQGALSGRNPVTAEWLSSAAET